MRFVVNVRARRISIRIDTARREAIVTAPSKRSLRAAADFARSKTGGINSQLARLPAALPLQAGAAIPLRGEEVVLEAAGGRGPSHYQAGPPPRLVITGPDFTFEGRCRRLLKHLAREDVETAVAGFARAGARAPKRIRISDTTSRWGSCSSTGTMSISWRLICAPPPVLSYVVAHELAHFDHMDHSPAFWARVGEIMPDYKKPEAWLKRHGAQLHALGGGLAPEDAQQVDFLRNI